MWSRFEKLGRARSKKHHGNTKFKGVHLK